MTGEALRRGKALSGQEVSNGYFTGRLAVVETNLLSQQHRLHATYVTVNCYHSASLFANSPFGSIPFEKCMW
jgi:hypothetical protein